MVSDYPDRLYTVIISTMMISSCLYIENTIMIGYFWFGVRHKAIDVKNWGAI